MAVRRKRKALSEGRYSVTAPNEPEKFSPEYGAALSAAITLAMRAKDEVTVYVRDFDGATVGRVERDEYGNGFIYGSYYYRQERRAA